MFTTNLFVVKRCRKVGGDRLDDGPHGEGAAAEHGVDVLPVSSKKIKKRNFFQVANIQA